MRWNVAVAALAGSWGFIALIVAHVRLEAEALVFYRVGIGAVTAAVLLALFGEARRLLVARRDLARLVLLGCGLAAHWFLYFETIKLASVAIAVVTVY